MHGSPLTGHICEIGLDGTGRIVDATRRGYPFHVDQIALAQYDSAETLEDTVMEGRRVSFELSARGRIERVWLETDAARSAVNVH